MAPVPVTVTAQYGTGQSGVYPTGRVVFKAVQRTASPAQNLIIQPLPRTAYLDENGSISVRLLAADDPVDGHAIRYQVTEEIEGIPEITYEIEVGEFFATGGINLADVTRFDVQPIPVNIVTTADINQPNGVAGLDGTGALAGYVTAATLATLQSTVQALAATVATLNSRETTHYADLNARIAALES